MAECFCHRARDDREDIAANGKRKEGFKIMLKNTGVLEELSREQLYELIELYSKNWLALDGVWFQSVESKLGMDEAMEHDEQAWKRFTAIEARRIKQFLHLPEQAGLEGLARALRFRFYANLNRDELRWENGALIYRAVDCRVQTARARKGMPFHPCKRVGLVEYAGFAKGIDERIECECLSCYPDINDDSCCCAWRFTLPPAPDKGVLP